VTPSWLLAACCLAAVPSLEEVVLPEAPPPTLSRVVQAGVQIDLVRALNKDMQTVHGLREPLALEVWGAWLFGERAGVGIRGGVSRRRGVGVAPTGVAPPDTVLWQAPLAIEGTLRLALVRDQPVVPYVRAGAGVVMAWERVFSPAADPQEDEEAEEEVVDSRKPREPDEEFFWVKAAVHGGGGVQVRVPFPEVQWQGTMAGVPALSDVYVYVEGWGRAANNVGAEGADFSAAGLSLGATVLF